MNNYPISEGQREVLEYIRSYVRVHKVSPKVREIGAACGIRSRGLVARRLDALEARGLITRVRNHARGIRLCGEGSRGDKTLAVAQMETGQRVIKAAVEYIEIVRQVAGETSGERQAQLRERRDRAVCELAAAVGAHTAFNEFAAHGASVIGTEKSTSQKEVVAENRQSAGVTRM